MLKPEEREIELGRAEVRALFRVPRVGVVAGSYVVSGNITRNSRARVVRDGVVVYEGRIGSLRRFKDDVREVAEGFECGISIENFQDVHEGDIIEAFEVREVARQL
jgi:translation initiation factor IF-2